MQGNERLTHFLQNTHILDSFTEDVSDKYECKRSH